MLAPDYLWNYACNLKACCCITWRVTLNEHDYHRLVRSAAGTDLAEVLPEAIQLAPREVPLQTPAVVPPRGEAPRFDTAFASLSMDSRERCRLLDGDLCRVHGTLGPAALPEICRNFPIAGLVSPDGVETFWEFVCPEVAIALARAERPARIAPPPDDYHRGLEAFAPQDGLPTVRLTEETVVPFAGFSRFRRDAVALLADCADRPIEAYARIFWYVHEWATHGDIDIPLSDYALDQGMYAAFLLHLAEIMVATVEDPAKFKSKTGQLRRFVEHLPTGPETTLDLLDAELYPPAGELAETLAAFGPEEHLVLTNYLIAKTQALPLQNSGWIDRAHRWLAETLARALLAAGIFARAADQPAGRWGMAAAVSIADYVGRGSSDVPRRLTALRSTSALTGETMTGTIADLRAAVALAEREPQLAAPFTGEPECRVALDTTMRLRLEVALDTFTDVVKASLQVPADELPLLPPLAMPWDDDPELGPELARRVAHADAAAAQLWERLDRSDDSIPLAALARRLRLDPLETWIVGLLHLAESDTGWARALAHASLDYGAPHPTTGALVALFGSDAPSRLAPEGRLRSLDLVRQEGARVVLAPRLHTFLLGGRLEHPQAAAGASPLPDPAAPLLPPPEELVDAVGGAAAPFERSAGLVVLIGPDGYDRAALVRGATRRDVDVLRLAPDESAAPPAGQQEGSEGGAMPDDALLPDPTPLLRLAVRDALLEDRDLLIELGGAAARSEKTLRPILLAAERLGRRLFVSAHRQPSALYGRLPLRSVEIPPASDRDRLALLVRSLPHTALLEDPRAIRGAVRGLAIPPSRLVAAARHAATEATLDKESEAASGRKSRRKRARVPVEVTRLLRAMRNQMASRIGDHAEAMAVTLTWDDLQLAKSQKSGLREIVSAYRYRHRVLNEWGFGARVDRGNGITALFYGPPGTGKTMAAGILAREMGLEIFRVDLSRIVDKYIGESEKRLAQVFDEAERGEVLLLFDEADSLFGKRTKVKSATDRYANLEVNYLLQRMESYRGVVVLTTNHENLIDGAFKRRLTHQVHFPMPSAEQRTRIWQSLLPQEAPQDEELWFDDLGERFEMSGGHIRNAVLTAANLAAMNGGRITWDELSAGGNREYRSLGKVVRDADAAWAD